MHFFGLYCLSKATKRQLLNVKIHFKKREVTYSQPLWQSREHGVRVEGPLSIIVRVQTHWNRLFVKAGVMNSVRLHTKSAQTRHVKNWTVTAINNMDTQHCKWGLLTRQKNCVRIVSSSCVWHTAVSLHLKQKGQSQVKRDGQRREVRVGRDQVKVYT